MEKFLPNLIHSLNKVAKYNEGLFHWQVKIVNVFPVTCIL